MTLTVSGVSQGGSRGARKFKIRGQSVISIMAKKKSRMGYLNEGFLTRVMPELSAWGLQEHPNADAFWGKDESGYRFDFADCRDIHDVKMASFAIHHGGPSFWIKGHRLEWARSLSELPVLFDNIDDIFTLTPNWSILRPLNFQFIFHQRKNDTTEVAVQRLVTQAVDALPKLHRFLYS